MAGSSNRFLGEAHSRVGRWLRNKWHLDRLIAIGGMAAVYASTHRNGARAAIKLLHSQYTRNEQARRRFLAEGYAANKVGHRNAVLVLDDDTTEDGEVYLVMELLEGESLEGRLERLGVMGPTEVLAIADQLLEVLACAHTKGILHRDIKPANIYLTQDGSVKLLDFGLARVRELSAEALDQSDGIVFGTVSYIAPEQARADNQNLDARSDMWSIAATMFRSLAGETVHPSTGPIIERLMAVARKPARSLASLAPHLPRPLIELVDRALAFDPEDRWPSANVMRVVVQDVMAQLQEEAEAAGEELDVEVQQPAVTRRTNTLPPTTRSKTSELPSVRAGLGPAAAADDTVRRPKTDPVALSTRPRNLPPSEPGPSDGDETDLNLDGLYEKRDAAPGRAGRSRTLLTKEGRAELRRILDARRAAGGATSEPAATETPARKRHAGSDTSGVGDIEVEFEDSIIQVTIDHTRQRSGPVAERLSEPSSATPMAVEPAPAPSVSPSVETGPAIATTDAGVPVEAEEAAASEDEAAAPPVAETGSYTGFAVEVDEEDEVYAAAESSADLAVSPAPSGLRPPSVPPHQPVPSDSPSAGSLRPPSVSPQAPGAMTLGGSRPAQADITRVGPPPRPGQSAREITKVGPAPVAPPAPPAPPTREAPRPPVRPNSGSLHETMRAGASVAPPARGPREDARPATTGVNTGLLNETIRPGAAPPPTHSRSGPIPAQRAEGEPARSTMFVAPTRPTDARPAPEATPRSVSFMPPPGRVVARPSSPPEERAPSTGSGAMFATSRLPLGSLRPPPGAASSAGAAPVNTGAAGEGDATSPATSPMSPATSNVVVASPTSPATSPTSPATSPATSNVGVASPTSPAARRSAAAPVATASLAVSKSAAAPAARSVGSTSSPSPAAAPGPASKPGATGPAASNVASTPAATAPIVSPLVVPSTPAFVPSPRTGTPTPAPLATPPAATSTTTPPLGTPPAATSTATPPAVAPPVAPPAAVPEVAVASEPAAARSGRSVFNPYPSLAGGARPDGAAGVKTASYAALGAAGPKDSAVLSPNPRTSPSAKTAPHAAAESTVPKDSPETPGLRDSSTAPRASSPGTKTAAYATVGADDPKAPESARGSGEGRARTGAAPVLPFGFLRGAAKPGEPAAQPPAPEDPDRPGRKKP